MTTDPIVGIAGLNKWYGDFHVLKNINLKVMRGERIVAAPSYCTVKEEMLPELKRRLAL